MTFPEIPHKCESNKPDPSGVQRISTNLWVVEPLIRKICRQIGSFPQCLRGDNKKIIWNHHLGMFWPLPKHWFTEHFMKVCLGSLHTNEFRLFSHCEPEFWQAPMYVRYPKLKNLHCKQIHLPLYGLLVDQSSKTTTCWMRYHEILLGQVLELLDSPKKNTTGVSRAASSPLIQTASKWVNYWTAFVQKHTCKKWPWIKSHLWHTTWILTLWNHPKTFPHFTYPTGVICRMYWICMDLLN